MAVAGGPRVSGGSAPALENEHGPAKEFPAGFRRGVSLLRNRGRLPGGGA
jgi:hypothetical protein